MAIPPINHGDALSRALMESAPPADTVDPLEGPQSPGPVQSASPADTVDPLERPQSPDSVQRDPPAVISSKPAPESERVKQTMADIGRVLKIYNSMLAERKASNK